MDETRDPQEAPSFSVGTSIDDLIKNAYWRADGLGEAEVVQVSPVQYNVYYPSDGSMVTLRIEARPGAWGGVRSGPLDDQMSEAANQRFEDSRTLATPQALGPEPEPEPAPTY